MFLILTAMLIYLIFLSFPLSLVMYIALVLGFELDLNLLNCYLITLGLLNFGLFTNIFVMGRIKYE